MVSHFRDFIQKKGYFQAAVALILGGGLLYSSISLIFISRSSRLHKVATVNGKEITQREVQHAAAKLQEFLRYYPSSIAQSDLKKKALELVVHEKVVEQAIDDLSLQLSSDYIASCLHDPLFVMTYLRSVIPPYLVDPESGVKSKELSLFLKNAAISGAEFDKILEKAIKLTLFSDLVNSLFYVSEDQIKESYLRQYAPKKFLLFKRSLAPYINRAQSARPDERELRAFYDTQRAKGLYFVPEKRDVSLWVFNPGSYQDSDTKKNADSSKKTVEQRFRAHFKSDVKKHFSDDFKQFALSKKAHLEIKRGLTHSEALKGSAALKKAFVLGKGGKDAVIDGHQGIVLQVDEIYPSYVQEFEVIRPLVEKDYYYQEATKLALEDIKQARKSGALLDKTLFTQESFSLLHGSERDATLKKIEREGVAPASLLAMNTKGAFEDGVTDIAVYSLELKDIGMNNSEYESKRNALREDLQRETVAQAQRAWLIASLARSAKINIYNPDGTQNSFEW